MIKTIKVKKQLRLDELIKYAFDNDIKNVEYVSNDGGIVRFNKRGHFELDEIFVIKSESIFTVEIEKEIDNDTIFEKVYRVTQEGEVTTDKNMSINDCLDWKDYQVQIFAMLDGKLELIWSEL